MIDAALEQGGGGDPHSHPRAARRFAACCPSAWPITRLRTAAGGGGGHQRRRRDRRARAPRARPHPGRLVPHARGGRIGDTVFVANGTRARAPGPNAPFARRARQADPFSIFPLPDAGELAADTAVVMEANGFRPAPGRAPPLPAGLRHVVLIVKENRTYDEVFGDMPGASNGPVMSTPEIARFGRAATWTAGSSASAFTISTSPPTTTPSRAQWAFSDNFYADSRRQRGRPSLAGGRVPERLDREFADGGLQHRQEGLSPGARRPAVCSSRAPIPPCIPKSSWKAAPSGITWSATASRSAISAKASNWPAWMRAATSNPPARASSPTCPCPTRSIATPRATIPGST